MPSHVFAASSSALVVAALLAAGCSMDTGTESTGVANQASTRSGGGGSQGSSGGRSSSSSSSGGGSGSGSSSGGGSSSSSSSSGAASGSSSGSSTPAACPSVSSQDDQMRAAASAAYSIMKLAAQSGGSFATSILAAQRYRIQSSGVGIEFDPTDPVYSQVTTAMKAALAIAQLDSSVAQFLSDGLNFAYKTSNGSTYPLIRAIPALANFHYPTTLTTSVPDTTATSDVAIVTGSPWCGAFDAHIAQTLTNTWQYSPLFASAITDWRGNPPAAFKGTGTLPTVPFNGPSSAGNPYLVVSVNGTRANWGSYNFVPTSCFDSAHYNAATGTFICTGSIDIDPIPYAVPGVYYDTSNTLVGPQANPFALVITSLYADASHAGQWATRTLSGVQQWGTFSIPVSVLGTTIYLYSKKM